MKRTSQAVLSLIVVALLSLTGCMPISETRPEPLPESQGSQPEPESEPEPEPEPDPAGQLVELSPTATCLVAGDLEGQFTSSSEMASYLDCVLPGVDAWIDTVYSAMSHPNNYFFVPNGVSGEDAMGCPYDATALQYCLGLQDVYLGEDAVWLLYSRFGDAAPMLVVAHEVTHSFQREAGMPVATTPNEEIRYENQADCGAGAFMNYARNTGLMDAEDDIIGVAGALEAAGEAESTKQTHGTIEERLSSFDQGYFSTKEVPLFSCVSFVPEVPIIVGG